MTSDNRLGASRVAPDQEVHELVRTMGEVGAGIFQLAMKRGDRSYMEDDYRSLATLSRETGRPITFGSLSRKELPGHCRELYRIIEEENLKGARIFTQVHSREINTVLSFETSMPFDSWNVWSEFRRLPLEVQFKKLSEDMELRRKLVEVAESPYVGPEVVGAEPRPPEWDMFYVMERVKRPHRSISEISAECGKSPAETMLDVAVKNELKVFFRQPIANENQEDALELMKHPYSNVTFSDSGAHVSQIMDSSLQTHLLSHWVREKEALSLEQAVRFITYDTATNWGFHDRGLIREGMTADINVFDPEKIEPQMPLVVNDLPSGAKRLKQYADGILATVIAGKIVLKDKEHTGELPGKLLRGPLYSQC